MKPNHIDYITNKYYLIEYTHEKITEKFTGLLLDYNPTTIIILSTKGIYHLKHSDITFMKPISADTFELRIVKAKEEYKTKTLHCFKKLIPNLYIYTKEDQTFFLTLVTDILNEDYKTIEQHAYIKLFEEDQNEEV